MSSPIRTGTERLPTRLVRSLATPPHRVIQLGAVVLLAALALFLIIPEPTTPIHGLGWWPLPVVVAGFIVSEPLVFHIESRNEAVSFSPSDVPLALGILTLSPLGLVIARLVGAGAGLLIFRRQPLFKFTLNLCSFAAEASLAIAVFRLLFGTDPAVTPITWLGLTVSLLVGLVVGGMIIATAISFFEGDLRSRMAKELSHIYLFHVPGALLGASVAIPVPISPWLALVYLGPAPIVWLVLRSHGSLMHRYTDLSHIHEFSSEISRPNHLDELVEVAAREISGYLRARAVGIVVWDESGRTTRAAFGDDSLLAALPLGPDEVSSELRESSTVVSAVDTDRSVEWLRAAGVREAIVVPLHDGDRSIGLLVVADRHGATDTFSEHDHERLQPITRQLAVALRRSQLHLEIQHQATHDRLTGIANRAYFEAWTEQVLEGDADDVHGLLLIDLDRFKEVNDTLGHKAGDELLVEVTARIRSCLTDNDFPSRLGGDEFAVLVTDTTEDAAMILAEVISDALERPFQVGETTVAIASSIGIALSPLHGNDCDQLLHRADVAMYHAKRNHIRAALFRPDLDAENSEQLSLLADLRLALDRGELDVHFQPQIDVHTGAVHAAEALARWQHPTRGVVSPAQFVTVAEQAGLIGALTEHVLDRSLAAVRHWLDQGRALGVSVNLSAVSLFNDDLARVVRAAIERADVPAHLLTLEITESTMLGDTPRTSRILRELAELGLHLSVDDFGSGFSSLASLRHLPFTELKIDRSFVTRMLVEPNDEVIVRSTIALGHALGMRIVAEGVETAQARAALGTIGCDLVQGFEICRPLPLAELDTWLSRVHDPQALSSVRA